MPKNIALNISVGALLDSSLGKTFSRVTKATDKLGSEQKKLNQQLRKISVISRYTKQLEDLKKEATESGEVSKKLADKIKQAEFRLSTASAEAAKMGVNVADLGSAEKKLNQQLERNNRTLQRRASVSDAFSKLGTGAGAISRGLASSAFFGSTVLAGLVTGITYTNQLTAQQANLAQAVGLSAKEMGIWSAIVKQAGFDGEHVNSLVEELNNKFGESKGLSEQTTNVKESMKILRLDFERIKQLKPDKQFQAIVEAAQKLGGQKASGALDILLGGEASRIIGYLNSLDMPISELFKRFDRLYVGSQEGIQGAKSFSGAWGELSYTLGQSLSEVTGLIGSVLAPQMKTWAEQLADSFKTNRDQIKQFAGQLGTTLSQLGTGLAALATNLPTIVNAMVTLSKFVVRWFGDNTPAPLTSISGNQIQGGSGHGGIAEQLRQQLNKPVQTAADNRMNVTYNITQQPGETGEQLANRIDEKNRALQNSRVSNDSFIKAGY